MRIVGYSLGDTGRTVDCAQDAVLPSQFKGGPLYRAVVHREGLIVQPTIKAVIRPGEQSGYIAECLDIPVVTQGRTLDEVTREAVALHLDGENLAILGLAANPTTRRMPRFRRLDDAEVVGILGRFGFAV